MRAIKYLMLIVFLVLSAVAFSQQKKPNVVFILTDDQGWGDLSMHGNPYLKTPNLDKLASDGVQFDRFFVSPLCAPSRASFLTGRYHLRTGTATVTRGLETMRSEELTLAEAFKQNGYKTGIFGKWHNGEHYPENPNGQGFDEFYGFCAGHWNKYFDAPLEHNGQPVTSKGYITDVLADHAMEFIEKNKSDQFFCYVPFNAPHGPFIVEDKYFDKYKAMGLDNKVSAIYGMVENIDVNVGRILDKINSLGLADNTIVIFSTDNGPVKTRYNGNMKGWKSTVHEGGTRVPFFIRWPGKIKAGSKVTEIAAHIDLLPTLTEMCGLKVTGNQPWDGVSLVPLINGRSLPARTIYTHVYREKASTLTPTPGAARTQEYRFVRMNPDSLFDMINDPGEKTSLSDQKPELLASLRTSYDAWFADVTKNGIGRPKISTGYEQSPRVVLPATEAYFNNMVAYKGKNGFAHDWLTNWTKPQDSIWWEINAVKDATYEVTLYYTVPADDTGATVKASTPASGVTGTITKAFDPPLDDYSAERAPREGQPEKQWASLSLGKMKFSKGQYRFVLQASAIKGKQVGDIKEVVLERK